MPCSAAAQRSWLTPILKHKIVDLLRQRAGTDRLDDENKYQGALTIVCPDAHPDD